MTTSIPHFKRPQGKIFKTFPIDLFSDDQVLYQDTFIPTPEDVQEEIQYLTQNSLERKAA